jgi:hypothetical protein
MLAAVLKAKKTVICGGVIVVAISLISCATESKPVSVVDDPDAKKETAIPWNQQQKWEQGQEMGGLANSDRAR